MSLPPCCVGKLAGCASRATPSLWGALQSRISSQWKSATGLPEFDIEGNWALEAGDASWFDRSFTGAAYPFAQ